MARKTFDCREWPGPCTLAISGTEEEVIAVQVLHVMQSHGLADGPEVRAQIRASLKADPSDLAAVAPEDRR